MNPAPAPSSLPPIGITWPMVAYAMVRELPYVTMILTGGGIACYVVDHIPGAMLQAMISGLAPTIIAALARSQPSESHAIRDTLERRG